MENRKLLRPVNAIVIAIAMAFGFTVEAQENSDLKKEFNKIKKDSEYIYGQSAGENEQTCYDVAFDDFKIHLKEYVKSAPDLCSAEAVILDNVQKAVKKISFERYINCKVVCVYIKKSDIKPLYKLESSSPSKQMIAVMEKEQANNEVKSVEKESKSQETANVAAIPAGQTAGEQKPTANEPAKAVAASQNAAVKIHCDNSKDSEILTEVCSLKDYGKIKKYLDNRKLSNHDVVFKGTTSYGTIVNAYWLVFSKSKALVAVLSKDKTINLMTNRPVSQAEFANSPKVWIQIF